MVIRGEKNNIGKDFFCKFFFFDKVYGRYVEDFFIVNLVFMYLVCINLYYLI